MLESKSDELWPYRSYDEMCEACGTDFEKPGSCEECLEDLTMNVIRNYINQRRQNA